MTKQTILAHFESRDRADDARDALIGAGVSADAMRLYPAIAPEGSSSSVSAYEAARGDGSLWASLADLLIPQGDRYPYPEGMSRGGATLSVETDAKTAAQISQILDRHGAIDMAKRKEELGRDGSVDGRVRSSDVDV